MPSCDPLEFHSDVFNDMLQLGDTRAGKDGEVVKLEEPSAVLEILFQYIYRQAQPDLDHVPFEVFAQVAEAAEKYQIHAAIATLRLKMR